MATSANDIADKAMQIYNGGQAKTIPQAVWKALAAKGIVNSGDQKRLFDAATAQLGRRSASVNAAVKRDRHIQQKVSA